MPFYFYTFIHNKNNMVSDKVHWVRYPPVIFTVETSYIVTVTMALRGHCEMYQHAKIKSQYGSRKNLRYQTLTRPVTIPFMHPGPGPGCIKQIFPRKSSQVGYLRYISSQLSQLLRVVFLKHEILLNPSIFIVILMSAPGHSQNCYDVS